jgi:RNA polymerase sigma-70 factor (ECF subfamily)
MQRELASTIDVAEQAWTNVLKTKVRTALAQLPAAQRTVIELAYFEGLSHHEIATQLDEPLGTVHTRMRLGLAKLKDSLAELRLNIPS